MMIFDVENQIRPILATCFKIRNEKNIFLELIYEPKPIPVCKTVVGILNGCFTQTDCLSQSEMNLIRDFFATYYFILMEFVVQSVAKFGSMSNFMDAAGVD